MTDLSAASSLDATRAGYLAMTRQKRMYSGLTLALFVIAMIMGFRIVEGRSAGGFLDGLPQVFDFPASLVTEAWEKRANLPGYLVEFFPALIETINIAAVSTLLGAGLGLLLSLLSTRGLAPFPRLIPVFRRIMDILRAFPEIVIALVLIFILGGGPVPAMIAIALHTAGALGKLFSEVSENVDLKPVEGLQSVGAGWWQRMLLGVIPQVAPNYLSYALMRFEINVRASAILGFVGAGGIGYELRNAMTFGTGRFDVSAAIFILLFLTIVFFDQISSYYRNKLVHGNQP
ncbi:phosphonate ABC transporter, permease protein PhnE [Frigidibacter albus]|uniref:Phosphonate ABC transporter, permease protein PhnE n=1 Tax=Frigidibacter albus TaxID=1465486 RepID=A0A6L8VDL4_9RHOB|nr:phosphonate ABC transporter, permease protein PhnE [Frigidibacter albus]MZQ88284.1 phosphonate ABC transporter, permease protein PhnE [Frigidibacter albus]NBE30042.1 phosphonate ABC transporter, permease protein PhnE [Frigidibacter albus]GGH46342.1 phosphonate ABC transporter, permease protein PhnE [Frigidibacter albus]